MSRYLQIKVAFSVIGLILLIWGIRTDDRNIRWFAIGFLAISVLMRFLPRRLRGGGPTPPPPRSPDAPGT